MSFLEPFFLLLFIFFKKLVKVEASKDHKANSNNDPKGGVFCACEKSKDAVTTIAQKGNAQ